MRIPTIPVLAMTAATLASVAPAQDSLLFVSRYDSVSIDDMVGRLSQLRPFGIGMVTPGSGATATQWIPSAGISAVIGDPDGDSQYAEFNGLPDNSWSIGAPFVKQADKAKGDPRLVYWSIRETIINPPTIALFDGTGTHVVRVGDWVRVTDNGDVEFFIKREQFTKAMGAQTGAFVEGATAICQAPNGDIYYTPAHAEINGGGRIAGGHWVSNGTLQVFAFDGAICYIPNAAITYDANGNVQDVAAGSARLAVNEVGSGPNGQPSIRDMCNNSMAVDRLGQRTRTTFFMTGLEIDPNGGTFPDWFDPQRNHPNLIFTFGNADDTCCGGLGSWLGTVFSTAGATPGSIATLNGVAMGSTTLAGANGSWTGIKAGSGNQSAPVLRGLALIRGSFNATAPYGTASLQTDDDGVVSVSATNAQIGLSVQGPGGFLPGALFLNAGPLSGGRQIGTDASALVSGWATLHVGGNGGPFLLSNFGSDAKGQATRSLPVPNNPTLVGQSLMHQAVALNAGGSLLLTNPVVTDFRM